MTNKTELKTTFKVKEPQMNFDKAISLPSFYMVIYLFQIPRELNMKKAYTIAVFHYSLNTVQRNILSRFTN